MRAGARLAVFGVLSALFGAALAHSDSECAKGFRDTTSAERAAMQRALEAAKAALPPAPEGWAIGGYEAISVRTRICSDADATPWLYTLSRTYVRSDDVEAREQALKGAGGAVQADLVSKQPRMDALTQRMQELGADLATAAQSGDQARVDAISGELERVSKQLESVMNEGDAAARAENSAASAMQDVEMSIVFEINPGYTAIADMQPYAAPPGARRAFRGNRSENGVTRAHSVVLLGEWRTRSDGALEPIPRAGASPAAAQALAIHATADPARIDALMSSVDVGAAAAVLR